MPKRPLMPSPWLEDAPEPVVTPALTGDRDVDVCIVGAGYTGLSTAIAMRDQGRDVLVLEAQRAGWGASGRNAGHLTPTIGKDIPMLRLMYRRKRVRGLLRLADVAIGHTEQLIDRFAIDCAYEPVGNIVVAVHPGQHRNLKRSAAAAARYEVPAQLLDRDALQRRGIPAHFSMGLLEPHGGILDPARYVLGLRAAAQSLGAELCEHTPVNQIRPGSPAVVRTPDGTIRARQVIVATNGYGGVLANLHRRHIVTYVQLFRTSPLTSQQLAAVGWAGREGLYTAHEMLESYRLTQDNRIIGGAKLVRHARVDQRRPDADPAVARILETAFRTRFPMLNDLAIEQHWGGQIAFGLDLLPLIGTTGDHDEIAYAIAYAGHGISLASYAGTMMADLLAGRDGAGTPLWSRHQWLIPPDPVRGAIVATLTGVFGHIDRRRDDFDWG